MAGQPTDVVEQVQVDAVLVAQNLAHRLGRVRFLLELAADLIALAQLLW